jgi:hypothetical protein
MRRFRLNGWQRIGIVIAVVWMIVGGLWGWRHANDKADADFKFCITQIQTASDVQACRAKRAEALVPNWFGAAVVALAPITVVGLFFYGLIFVARRIGRAFRPEPAPWVPPSCPQGLCNRRRSLVPRRNRQEPQ